MKYGYSDQQAADMWGAMEQTRQQGFGPEVTRRIMLGTFALSAGYYDAYYLKAQQARTLIRRDFDDGLRVGGRAGYAHLAGSGLSRWERRPATRCRCT